MRGRARQLLDLTAAVALSATLFATAPLAVQAQSDEEAIKQALVAMWDAIERGDLEA